MSNDSGESFLSAPVSENNDKTCIFTDSLWGDAKFVNCVNINECSETDLTT